MGNKPTNANQQLSELLDRFQLLQKVPERNLTFLEDRLTHKEYVLKEMTFNDQKDYNRNIDRLTAKKAMLEGHPNVVPLERYIVRTEDQFCSTFYKIYALFEYPYKTLLDEIHQRQLQHRLFREQELWSILASCILGLSHLQKFDIKHLGLRSNTILLTSTGHIQIADPWCTSQPTNYQSTFSKQPTQAQALHIYLPPEHCQALSQQLSLPPPSTNPYKSDVFTVGMIILQAGLLQFQDQCYKDELTGINWEKIERNLEKFGQIYSKDLRKTLEEMLAEKERPEWVDLEQHVRIGETFSQSADTGSVPTPRRNQGSRVSVQSRTVLALGGSAIKEASTPMEVKLPPNIIQSQGRPAQPQPRPNSNIGHKTTTSQIHQPPQPSPPPAPRQHSVHPPQPQSRQIIVQQPNPSIPTTTTYQQPLANPIPSTVKRSLPPFPSSTGVAHTEEILPVKQLTYNKPQFTSNLPANVYDTLTKIDQNLVEVSEDDILESQSSHSNGVIEPPVASPVAFSFIKGKQPEQSPANIVPPIRLSNPTPQNSYFPFNTTFQAPIVITSPSYAAPAQSRQSNITPAATPASITNQTPSSHFPPAVRIIQSTYQQPIFNGNGVSFLKKPPQQQPLQAYGNPIVSSFIINPINQINPQPQMPAFPHPPTTTTTSFLAHPVTFQTPTYQASSTSKQPNSQDKALVIETFKQGSRYQGEKVNGMRHGKGKFYYQDGGLYDGDWKENKMSGHGKLYYQSGNLAYEGGWLEDQFTGFGRLFNEEVLKLEKPINYDNIDEAEDGWVKFQGQFYNDQKQGTGKLYFSNGEWFQGMFSQDTANGPGQFHTTRGQTIQGVWLNNRLQQRTN